MNTLYFFVLIAVVASLPEVENGIHSRDLKQNYQSNDQSNYYDSTHTKHYKTNQKLAETNKKLDSSLTRKVHVTAWGIIGIILSLIIFSTITYYAFLLYPYMCKKEESYDAIELTNVNSVCTSSSPSVCASSSSIQNSS